MARRDTEATIIATVWRPPFRFIARLSNGLLRIYAGQYISSLIPPFVFLWPRRFFGRETFIKGYRGVTVKRGRVLTIGRSSEVISNNPFYPPLLGIVLSVPRICALKSFRIYARRRFNYKSLARKRTLRDRRVFGSLRFESKLNYKRFTLLLSSLIGIPSAMLST